jgi:hypothetical protein
MGQQYGYSKLGGTAGHETSTGLKRSRLQELELYQEAIIKNNLVVS